MQRASGDRLNRTISGKDGDPSSCARGGTGIRVGLRSLCLHGLESSSLSARTIKKFSVQSSDFRNPVSNGLRVSTGGGPAVVIGRASPSIRTNQKPTCPLPTSSLVETGYTKITWIQEGNAFFAHAPGQVRLGPLLRTREVSPSQHPGSNHEPSCSEPCYSFLSSAYSSFYE